MEIFTWIKDNGQEIEVNDRPGNIDQCKRLGWKRKKKEEAPAPPKAPTAKVPAGDPKTPAASGATTMKASGK